MKTIFLSILLSVILLTSCDIKCSRVVYSIDKIDSTYSRYNCYEYRWAEGANRVSTYTFKDSTEKHFVGDTLKGWIF